MSDVTLDDKGERMVPEHQKDTLMYAEHILRYKACLPLLGGKIVLDIASGSGYGCALISEAAKAVYGVDLSEEAIKYAEENYARDNITYRVGDAAGIPVEDSIIDVVVSFETLEHVDDPGAFIREVKRVLKPKGLFIVSTPNDAEYPEGNEFHVHEYSKEELDALLAEHFLNVEDFYQRTSLVTTLGKAEETNYSMHSEYVHPAEESIYFLSLCSEGRVDNLEIPSMAIAGEKWSYIEHNRRFDELTAQHKEINKLVKDTQDLVAGADKLRGDIEELQETISVLQGEKETLLNQLANGAKKGLRKKEKPA